jgi:hypothetical protein
MGEKVLVFEPDMLFSSRIESAAVKSGLEPKVAITLDELQTALRESVPKALLVNLDVFTSDCSSLVESVRGRCRLIGYYSHLDSKSAAWALASGFQQVIPRRAFMAQLNKILVDIGSG